MAFEARFVQGDAINMMDYVPGGAVEAGTVVVIGDIVGVTLLDIAAGATGNLNIGGGIYELVGDAAIAAGTMVYWNDTTNKGSATAGSNKVFGRAVTACAANNGLFNVWHFPVAV